LPWSTSRRNGAIPKRLFITERTVDAHTRHAEQWSAWGHRKIWGLLTADGVAASQASVRQPQHVPVEHPAALRVGWVQRQAAAQHVHGAMIAQQTHPERNARSKPRCRNRQRPGTPLFVIGRLCALRPLCGQAYQGKKGPEPATRLVRPVETEPTGESTL
jgi:hypothetical protein